MKATPKADEVINVLKQVALVVNLIEYNLREIEKADSPIDKANDIINAYQENLDYCDSCKVTAKDVYDEYWGICTDIESLPKCARAMAVRFENVGIPVWVCEPYSDHIKQVGGKINNMASQGIITKSQASDLMCLFDVLAHRLMYWVFRVQSILEEMGVKPKPLPTEEQEQKADEPDLPSELNTERARKYFAKAIKVGYMERTGNGYKWLFGGDKGQARLGYFCNKVYNKPRPINKLEELFEVKKLSASITNADSEAKRADVKQWRSEINDNIFND
ncbi:MAG: hypothetical protein PHC95_02285 [Parabacteroides sp.]|nr:hypothetical protein [Parabacteroides sp.]